MHDDKFDDFDWENWGTEESDDSDTPTEDLAPTSGSIHLNGRGGSTGPAARDGYDAIDDQDGGRSTGEWVTSGGVVHWEEPGDTDNPLHEAESPLAADDLTLPEGAPDAPRMRAVRAWLLRQRARETDALGGLLLAQREQQRSDESQMPRRRRAQRPEPNVESPLDLEIAEHQAAHDEYTEQLERLDEFSSHSGSGRSLVEYYLWLTDYLASLATTPDADDSAGPAKTRAGAIWRGRALAALAVRGRVERVAAPTADED